MLAIIVNQTLSILTIIAQAAIIGLVILVLIKKPPTRFLDGKIQIISFIVALVATVGSLTYSDIIGFEPCKLCWFQRILMYPQAVILGMALIKKDKNIVDYSILLSVAGAIIAAYHYLLQIGVAPSLACSAVGYSISCSQRFVLQFGYITIPMMALTAFVLITILMLIQKNICRKL